MKTTLIFCRNSHLFWLNLVIFALTVMVFITLPCCENDESTTLNDDVSLKTFSTTEILYYGHKTFTRGTGTPVVISHPIENPDFEHFDDNFTLHILNGKDSKTRVSSAEVWIDGVLVVGTSDLSKQVISISRQLSCISPESILEVKLNGKPGSFIDLWIEGLLKPGRSLIGSEGGTITSSDGSVELNVPIGALVGNHIIGINVIENQYSAKTEIAETVSPLIQLVGFEGSFLKEVELNIQISPSVASLIDSKSNVVIYQVREDLNSFIYQESIYNSESSNVTAYLKHFSTYGVVSIRSKLGSLFGDKSFEWSIQNFPGTSGHFPRTLSKEEVSNSLKQAIDTWGYHLGKIGYSFVQEDYSDFKSMLNEIKITWMPGLSWDGQEANALGGWSWTWDCRVVIFNDEKEWLANDIPRNPIPSIHLDNVLSIRGYMLHEFGHILGFKHLWEYDCRHGNEPPKCNGPVIMTTFSGYYRDYFELDQIDIDRLYEKYGISNEYYYENKFSGDLSDWTAYEGSWQIQNGMLVANYGIGCGSIYCPQGDLIVNDQFQPSGDWKVSVDFTYAGDSYHAASSAALTLWVSATKKIRISVGNAGFNDWGNTQLGSIGVGFGEWDGTWRKQINNEVSYIWNPKDWHTMTVEKTDNNYKVYVNDVYLWEYTDNYLNGSGKIGLQTYGPKTYDNFIIRTNN